MTTDEMMEGKSLLCPSAPGTEGTLLLGVIQHNKTINLLDTLFEVDHNFIEVSKNLGPLEKRFRFANTCIKSECRQWSSNACGALKSMSMEVERNLKPCSIRERCQWFHQDDAKACASCTSVITTNLEEIKSMTHPAGRV